MGKSKSLNQCISSSPSPDLIKQTLYSQKASSFDALYALASHELRRISPSANAIIEKDPSHSPSEDIGLSVDSTSSGTHLGNSEIACVSKQSAFQSNRHEKFILPLPSQPISPPVPIPGGYSYPIIPTVQSGSLNRCNPVYVPPVGQVAAVEYNRI